MASRRRWRGDENGAVGVMEKPQPPVLLADPQAGFVGLPDGVGEQLRADRILVLFLALPQDERADALTRLIVRFCYNIHENM